MQCLRLGPAWLLPGHTKQREGTLHPQCKSAIFRASWCCGDYLRRSAFQARAARSQGIIDISIGLGPQTVLMDSQDGMGDFRFLRNSIDDGDFFNGSELKEFTAHAGQLLHGAQHFPHEVLLHDKITRNCSAGKMDTQAAA